MCSVLLQLHVYGPAGISQYVDSLLRVSDTYLLMPVIIHEFTTQPPNLAGWAPEEVPLFSSCAAEGLSLNCILRTSVVSKTLTRIASSLDPLSSRPFTINIATCS